MKVFLDRMVLSHRDDTYLLLFCVVGCMSWVCSLS